MGQGWNFGDVKVPMVVFAPNSPSSIFIATCNTYFDKSNTVQAPEESAEATSEVGLKFLATLKNAKDKHGHLIASEFLVLPHKVIMPARRENYF